MRHFKLSVLQVFRRSKFRKTPQSSEATLPLQSTETLERPDLPHELVYISSGSQNLPLSDEDATEVGENEECEVNNKAEVESEGEESGELRPEVTVAVTKVGPEITPLTFPYGLARKTHLEMMVYRMYVALSDDEHEIADLRTRQCEKFTHIVRILFDPSSTGDKIMPSEWSVSLSYPEDGPFEMHIRCPAFIRGLSDRSTALTKRQLFLARKFITYSLPYRRDTWVRQGFKFPFSEEECESSRVLIVGPTDRSVDVMSIFVFYLSFLSGARSSNLLASIRRLNLVHSHWKSYLLDDMASTISNQNDMLYI